jgi:hypothetical protein
VQVQRTGCRIKNRVQDQEQGAGSIRTGDRINQNRVQDQSEQGAGSIRTGCRINQNRVQDQSEQGEGSHIFKFKSVCIFPEKNGFELNAEIMFCNILLTEIRKNFGNP